MSEPATPWPHAPQHQLSENGTYFVTAGTYLKAHHFRTPQRLEVLQRGLLTVTRDFGLAQLLGYEAYLSEIVSRAAELRASKRGKAWAGAGGKPISLVFGTMV